MIFTNLYNSGKINGILWVLVFSVMIFSACNRDGDNGPSGQGPANFEWIVADYITGTSVYFSADISGNLDEVINLGFCWSENSLPSLDDNVIYMTDIIPGIFSFRLADLLEDKTYFVRAFYTIEGNEFYSEEKVFQTTKPVQHDDYNYGIVKIGDQLWMGENLRTKTYNNGDSITSGFGMGNYSNQSEPKYYFYYDDSIDMMTDYGLLYTWHVVTDSRGVCPAGYRIPDIYDFEKLVLHLDPLATTIDNLVPGEVNMSAIAGGMLKATGNLDEGTGLWGYPNGEANNVTHMNVLPSGLRDPSGAFSGLGFNATFWSYTEEDIANAIMFYMHFFSGAFNTNKFSKKSGYAVRCMKDTDL